MTDNHWSYTHSRAVATVITGLGARHKLIKPHYGVRHRWCRAGGGVQGLRVIEPCAPKYMLDGKRLLQGATAASAEADVDLRSRLVGEICDGGEAGHGGLYGIADHSFDVDVVGGGETDADDTSVEEHVGSCVEHVGVTAYVGLEGVGERPTVDNRVSRCVVVHVEDGVVEPAPARQLVTQPDEAEDRRQQSDADGTELPRELVVGEGGVELCVEDRLVPIDVWAEGLDGVGRDEEGQDRGCRQHGADEGERNAIAAAGRADVTLHERTLLARSVTSGGVGTVRRRLASASRS